MIHLNHSLTSHIHPDYSERVHLFYIHSIYIRMTPFISEKVHPYYIHFDQIRENSIQSEKVRSNDIFSIHPRNDRILFQLIIIQYISDQIPSY